MGWKDAPLVEEEGKGAWEAAPIVEEQLQEQPIEPQQPQAQTQSLGDALGGFKERTIQRAENVWQPTTLGGMLNLKPGSIQEGIVGAPERLGRLGLGAFGSAADLLINTPIQAGMNLANMATGGRAGQAVQAGIEKTGIAKPLSKLAQKYQEYKEALPPSEQANLSAAMSGLEGLANIGGVKAAPKVATAPGKAIEATGKGIEVAGKSILKGELKIEKPLARKISKNIDQAKNKVVNTISKYGLEDVTGNFEKLNEKANNLYIKKANEADGLINDFTANNPDYTVDATDIFADVNNRIGKDIEIRPGERKLAYNTVNKIFNDVVEDALGEGKDLSRVTPSDLVKIKRSIGAKYKNFDRSAEPVKEAIYDEVQSSVIKKINSIVPEAGALNLEARDLKFVSDAAEAASSRIANQNKGILGALPDLIIASGGIGATLSNPERALPIIAGTGALMAGRRAVGQGKGASALISAGKGLQSTGELLQGKKTLKDMVTRKKGK